MERARNGQPPCLDIPLREGLDGGGDRRLRARDHRLPRGVDVGDPDAFDAADDVRDDIEVGHDGCHGARLLTGRLEDAVATCPRKAVKVVLDEDTSDAEGDVLTVAVSARHLRGNSQSREQPRHSDAGGAERGLCDVRLRELCQAAPASVVVERRWREDERAQVLAHDVRQRSIRMLDGASYLGERHRDVAQHAEALRPLARIRNAIFPPSAGRLRA